MSIISFSEQNIFLKIIFIIIGLIYSFTLRTEIVLLLCFINFIYFMLDTVILKKWGRSIIKVNAFLSSYLVLAILFNIDFLKQADFIVRLLFLLQLSIYLTQSIRIKNTFKDCMQIRKYKLIYIFVYFIISLDISLKYLRKSWEEEVKKVDHTSIINSYVNVFITCIQEGFSNLGKIERQIQVLINSETHGSIFFNTSNLFLMYQLTLFILILSF